MLRKAPFLLIAIMTLGSASEAGAQSLVKFLGPKQSAEIKYSPKHHIPYDDHGFSEPLKRKWKQARKRGAPGYVIDEINVFPGTPDAIGRWVDEAWDEAVASFTKCGGSHAAFASRMSPSSLKGGVSVEPTIWYEPVLKSYLAGGYYPDTRSIKVVNIYYGSTGDYRHARLLLKWEMKNHFAFLAGIQSEPYAADWPCNAK
ncbi:MAG TPA: hypothetical protein VJZ26_14710 [Blastocatellia bacterium]|nr:hypothetical protein [Blastocatellia bacterium]